MCLPHCPTYRLAHTESESPRGRIALLLALAKEELDADSTLKAHIDSCLTCRNCETVCPSGVQYSRLVVLGRELLQESFPDDDQLLNLIQGKSASAKLLNNLTSLYQGSPLQKLVRKSGMLGNSRLARLEKILPAQVSRAPLAAFYPALGTARGRVGLFTGCTGKQFDRESLHSAIVLLNHLGYDVHIPPEQQCCGALEHNQGKRQAAEAKRKANSRLFASLKLDKIVAIASGCSGHLKEYNRWQTDDEMESVPPFVDILELMTDDALTTLALDDINEIVAIHEPCSVRNIIGKPGLTEKLFKQFSQFTTVTLPDNDQCCGAAGSYMVTHQENADKLRDHKLDALIKHRPRYLVSANVGCALHLAAGARERGLDIEVLHPATLIARHLKSEAVRKSG